ncbi:MAG: nucleotidyltransferase family protein [Prolixibacteraceae bacterium]|nr:nucleotidyltransferase family protein [Prolixibacteraceae bacterium]
MKQSFENIIISTLGCLEPERIAVFGSYARGEQTQESDLDILVKFKKAITLLQLIKFENELSEKLGVKVDLVTEGALKNEKLKKAINKDLSVIL